MEKEDELSGSVTDSLIRTTPTTGEAELEERTVFINNLPIDTSEEEINQIYSRCGPLESIQLFNLRPDLDPGLETHQQRKDRRRKNKRRNNNLFTSYAEYRRTRPRTPVYGRLRFRAAEGYRAATLPELRVFGCVIRRHPVLSIEPRRVTTLHLERLPATLAAIDVEYRLARLLHPRRVHVTLDGMRGVGTGGSGRAEHGHGDAQDYSVPASCEIKFEDYQTAAQAYQWIRDREDGEEGTGNIATFMGDEECQVHWFRTPSNSMGYWTRELNF